MTQAQPQIALHLHFAGTARHAMLFYQHVFGGDLTVDGFSDFNAGEPGAELDHVLHATLYTPLGFTISASDSVQGLTHTAREHFALSLSSQTITELTPYWDQLSAGGRIISPFVQTPIGGYTGVCIDRYGVTWMLDVNTTVSNAAPAVRP